MLARGWFFGDGLVCLQGYIRMHVTYYYEMVKHTHSHTGRYQVIEEAASKLATTPDTPPMIKVLVELRRQVCLQTGSW